MRRHWLALLAGLVVASEAKGVTKATFASVIQTVQSYQARYEGPTDIENAIDLLAETNPYNIHLRMTPAKKRAVSRAIYAASIALGVDWRILLAISYVESGICTSPYGDKKSGKSGNHPLHWWSVGCNQINLRWWGPTLQDLGFTQDDLLRYDVNFAVAAAILKHYQDKYGFWGGVRRYNGRGKRAEQYLMKVKTVYYLIGGKK